MNNYRANEMYFTKEFTNSIVSTINNATGFLQMAVKCVSGVVKVKGNANKMQLSVNGSVSSVDSDWITVDVGENIAIVSIDGILEVTIDGSAGVFNLMAIQ